MIPRFLIALLITAASAVAQVQVAPITTSDLVLTVTPITVQILDVLEQPNPDPAVLRVLVNQLTPSQLVAFISSMSPAQVGIDRRQFSVALFLADLSQWSALQGVLPYSGAIKQNGDWVESARSRLAKQIKKEGYSPAVMDAAVRLMNAATSH